MSITRNYIYFFYGALGATAVMTVCSFFVPESPLFLYEKGQCDKARTLINKMSKMNGTKLHEEHWLLDKEEVYGYAPAENPELMVDVEGERITEPKMVKKIRNTLKPVGLGALALATSGNLSPPTDNNPIAMMRKNRQILVNM